MTETSPWWLPRGVAGWVAGRRDKARRVMLLCVSQLQSWRSCRLVAMVKKMARVRQVGEVELTREALSCKAFLLGHCRSFSSTDSGMTFLSQLSSGSSAHLLSDWQT